MASALGPYTIHRVGIDVPAPYPTVCKGYFTAGAYKGHVFEDPASLDASTLIPQLAAAGVTGLKIEGRQRSRAYVDAVVHKLRRVVDDYAAGLEIQAGCLSQLSEGQNTTHGAYRKTWR